MCIYVHICIYIYIERERETLVYTTCRGSSRPWAPSPLGACAAGCRAWGAFNIAITNSYD